MIAEALATACSAAIDDELREELERQLITEMPIPPAICPGKSPVRARLAPWQVALAKRMMIAQISGGLSLADIADRLALSVNHFIKAFRHSEGVAPYQWYMQHRVALSLALLRDEHISLSRVADACGFADQSHFTKAFKRLLGVSPGRWRRKRSTGPTSFHPHHVDRAA